MTPDRFDSAAVYNDVLTAQVALLRTTVDHIARRILAMHFVNTGLFERCSATQLFSPAHYRSPLAHQFTTKLLSYFIDCGNLCCENDQLVVRAEAYPIEPPPIEADLFAILHHLERSIPRVLNGVDGLMALSLDLGIDRTLQLWEETQVQSPVKAPGHHLAACAIADRLAARTDCVVFEGGAGVGAIVRHALSTGALSPFSSLQRYYFTEINPRILERGRSWLERNAPPDLFTKMAFQALDLNHFATAQHPCTQDRSVDLFLLDHVLYDLDDIDSMLSEAHRVLRTDGLLVFTMAYRQRPSLFYACEFLQSTLASYYRSTLVPGKRNDHGYLMLDAWRTALRSAGFMDYYVVPDPGEHSRWPFGGIVARKR